MKLSHRLIACAAALLFTAGTVDAGQGKGKPGKNQKPRGKERHVYTQKGHSYFHDHGYTRLHIPPGHYPPPGSCRIWYPDRSPGHQPPPGRCSRVPPGAWVIHRPRHLPDYVHVSVYEPGRHGRLLVVGEFDVASGVFMRVVVNR
jgi:hypothetical protein